MSQQAADLPRFVRVIGRYRGLVGIMAVLGLLVGVVLAALNPPVFTSRAFVLYQPACPAGAICGGPEFSGSEGVSVEFSKTVAAQARIAFEAGNVLSVTAVGRTAAQAEAVADAAARSLTVTMTTSDQGELVSQLLVEPATTASGTPQRLFGDALLGAVLGALAGIIAALAGSRTTIDPLPAPRGLAVGGEAEEVRVSGETAPAREENGSGIWLEQLAREHAEQKAARQAAIIGTFADPL